MFANSEAFSGFAVDDLEAAQKFYGETLGIRTSEQYGLLTLHLAGGRDTLAYPKPGHVPATYTILNFRVDDIDAAVDELVRRGVTLERYDGMGQDAKGITPRASTGPAARTSPGSRTQPETSWPSSRIANPRFQPFSIPPRAPPPRPRASASPMVHPPPRRLRLMGEGPSDLFYWGRGPLTSTGMGAGHTHLAWPRPPKPCGHSRHFRHNSISGLKGVLRRPTSNRHDVMRSWR